MFTRLVAVGVLALTLGVVINLCEAKSTDTLKLLGEWLANQPDRPGSDANPGNTTADHIRFVKKTVDSGWSVLDWKRPKEPVRNLLTAIARLDPDAACSMENLRATRDMWEILIKDKSEGEIKHLDELLTASFPTLLDYVYAIQDCYLEFDPASKTDAGPEYHHDPCLRAFNSIDQRPLSGPPGPWRWPKGEDKARWRSNVGALEYFYMALERKHSLERRKYPFSGDELYKVLSYALWDDSCRPDLARDLDPVKMTFSDEASLQKAFEDYVMSPCATFVPENRAQLEPVVLLGSFMPLMTLTYGGTMNAIRSASIYLNCQVLLELKSIDELSPLVRKIVEPVSSD